MTTANPLADNLARLDPATFVHATALAIGEAGILIRGRSGAGKSRLALDLVGEARRRGAFAQLVGDDRVSLSRRGGRVLARPHCVIAGQIESRGEGILEVAFETAIVLRLVVDIHPQGATMVRLPDRPAKTVVVCGVELPLLIVHASAPQQAGQVLDCLWRMRNA